MLLVFLSIKDKQSLPKALKTIIYCCQEGICEGADVQKYRNKVLLKTPSGKVLNHKKLSE